MVSLKEQCEGGRVVEYQEPHNGKLVRFWVKDSFEAMYETRRLALEGKANVCYFKPTAEGFKP